MTRKLAQSTYAAKAGEKVRVFVKLAEAATVSSCVPSDGSVIVGVSLRSVTRGFCRGGTQVRPEKTDHVIVREPGESWSDAIVRVGDLAADSILTVYLEHQSDEVRRVELAVDLVVAAPVGDGVPAVETGDEIMARYRRTAESCPPASLRDVAMRFVAPDVQLTFNCDGTRVVDASFAGKRVRPESGERQLLRAVRATARRSITNRDAARLRKTIKNARRSAFEANRRRMPMLASREGVTHRARRRHPSGRRASPRSLRLDGTAPPPRRTQASEAFVARAVQRGPSRGKDRAEECAVMRAELLVVVVTSARACEPATTRAKLHSARPVARCGLSRDEDACSTRRLSRTLVARNAIPSDCFAQVPSPHGRAR